MFQAAELPYEFDALEPHIDAKTMEVHHGKHYATYIKNLNTALEKYPELQEKSIEELLSDLESLPADIRTAVRNNGGGYYNHDLFWTLLTADFVAPEGELFDDIEEAFGSFENFQAEFNEKAIKLFGSGWVWLSYGADKGLHIEQFPLQDNPIMHGHQPILGLDVWEHAYYLKYQNKRADYITAWWNVINWDKASELYAEAIA